ncbi:MAG TPA: 3'-5' exonuclease [Candidatus Limnocylindria bacterium]|nr:3'-5' exonuclease [Candidatus Limnocylindria bacterium]
MNYIVMDLEWNQPLSHNSPQFMRFRDQLMFDLIQIGAVRMDGNRRMTGSFSQVINPGCYRKLHPRISRITGIVQADLDQAPDFNEAFLRFKEWCGGDFVLMTWGCDDISVFQQNLSYYMKDEAALPPVYDLQRLYGQLADAGHNRAGLSSAMERYGIQVSDEHPFHSAVDDAYYTALVFQRMPDPQAVLSFPQTARAITPAKPRSGEKADDLRFTRIEQALASKPAAQPNCPVCGKRLTVPEGYVPMRGDVWRALADCPDHGLVLVDILMEKGPDGKARIRRRSQLSEQQNPAYVRTKHLQWAAKAAQAAQAGARGESA